MSSRRQFLLQAQAGLLGAAAVTADAETGAPAETASAPAATPGAPPTFDSAAPVGPPVSAQTFAEAEKLMRVTLTPAQRELAAGSWPTSMAPLMERRAGPKRVAIPDGVAPASLWQPARFAAAGTAAPAKDRFVRTPGGPGGMAVQDFALAFAPVARLARWIEAKWLSSERLTEIYLRRIEHFDPALRSFITVSADHALERARAVDKELAAGHYRGPLHGIPYGVKDLLDTAGIATTWGAEPLRGHVPAVDATVVKRLDDAGAIMLGKLSLGALALNDIWYGGQTMNPWVPGEGASGSSAGPGAATAAGLVAFAIGSETGGSIVSPSMRCGVTGLRPTFGRVPRTGAMTLCWSLDKLGPMTRYVEDAMLVLKTISGPDAGDASCVAAPLDFDATAPVKGLRVGYVPAWMQEAPATQVDRDALKTLESLGLRPVPVTLPDWPYDTLDTILFAETAASFEGWALDGRLDQLREQGADAWPNTMRQARFLSAVDLVQAERLRAMVAGEMARVMAQVDLLLVPSLRDDILTITNHTGHPSLTLRAGFVDIAQARSDWAPDPARPLPTFDPPRHVPHGVTLIGRLFDEGTIARVGMAFEKAAGVAAKRPPGYE